ncbi:1210_t:CDS:2 [Racocetra fulgida]|uniref:1210_t:CDS:1 n=1 Tax=Racocetra fulgida TaxID=60492 RepID=A0A9N9FSD0_9GLOM|nr:1210_t:CDS:2 [Racocetra fulgida]
MARIVELEQSAKESAENTKLRDVEINELRSRVSKLEQKNLQNDKETSIYKSYKDTNQSSVNDISTEMENSNDVSSEVISQSENAPVSDIPENISNSDISEISVTKNHEKSSDQISDMFSNKIPEQNIELIDFSNKPLTNLIIEQELQQQIAMSTKSNNSSMVVENSMQDIDIFINDLSPVSAQTIVCIFRKVIRSSQDTILYWYHFAGKYDRRIDEVSVSNKVGKKKATSLVYHEIKQLLPDITDVNLRHKILKARKIRTLFIAVGIEKIRQVSYSANAISSLRNEKNMWEEIEDQLYKIDVEKLGYNHPLYSEILDESFKPFMNMTKQSIEIFRDSRKNFILPTSTMLKDICEKFVQEKQEKYNRPSRVYGDAIFGKFLDEPEKLRELTNQILTVLNQVWSSPKWKTCKESQLSLINEGSYVSEVLSPLINVIMSDLPVDSDVWGIWKGLYQRARHPDYMVVAQVSNVEVEIGYLETGRPKSSLDKQI